MVQHTDISLPQSATLGLHRIARKLLLISRPAKGKNHRRPHITSPNNMFAVTPHSANDLVIFFANSTKPVNLKITKTCANDCQRFDILVQNCYYYYYELLLFLLTTATTTVTTTTITTTKKVHAYREFIFQFINSRLQTLNFCSVRVL